MALLCKAAEEIQFIVPTAYNFFNASLWGFQVKVNSFVPRGMHPASLCVELKASHASGSSNRANPPVYTLSLAYITHLFF